MKIERVKKGFTQEKLAELSEVSTKHITKIEKGKVTTITLNPQRSVGSLSISKKDETTGKEYSINSRLSIDKSKMDIENSKCSMKNGLLYIEIPYKVEPKAKEKTLKID